MLKMNLKRHLAFHHLVVKIHSAVYLTIVQFVHVFPTIWVIHRLLVVQNVF